MNKPWTIAFHPAFEVEFNALPAELQIEMFAHARLLEHFGPSLRVTRPGLIRKGFTSR